MDSVFPSLSPEKHYICEVNDKPHINMEHNILIHTDSHRLFLSDSWNGIHLPE